MDRAVGALRAGTEIHETSVDFLPLLESNKIDPQQIPHGCELEQIGQQTFATGTLEVVEKLRSKLSSIDQLLFKLHERYLRVLWHVDKGNDPDIQAVRTQVFNWAKDPPFVEFLDQDPPVGACYIPMINSSQMCIMTTNEDCTSPKFDEGPGYGGGVFYGGLCGPI